jgi:hypothetical protein
MKTEMNEEEFKNLISGEIDDAKHYALMKLFFKDCLYIELGDEDIAKQKRNLFINIIYNGFKSAEYENWTKNISDYTKGEITKGIKEKRLKKLVKSLLNSEFELNIEDDKTKSNPEDSDGDGAKTFIDELSKKWLNNEQKSDSYYNEIKKIDQYYYIIIGEDAPYGGAYLLGQDENDKKGPYYTSIKNLFNEDDTLSKILIAKKILFFDLLTIPLPIYSDLRKKWSTDDDFKIDNKQLPVFLLEVAFEHFQLKSKIKKNTEIAIMMPTKTSAGIYNYFEQVSYKDDLYCLKDRLTAKSCWQEIKSNHETIITQGKCFNYYKSNTISGSNTPDPDLLKYALNKKP